MADHRIPSSAVEGLDAFDTLQTLHEAAVERLFDGRLGELTPGMRALTVLFAVCGEVGNGGFAACMYNSAGDWTGEAITAARLVGADEHAAVLEEFARVGLGGDLTMSWDARNARLEAMSDEEAEVFEALDDRFFALPEIESFLTPYVERRPEEFFSDRG